MKHLGHQNHKKDIYDGDMVVYRGTMGDFWGVMRAKREAKECPAINFQPRGGPGMGQGWARDGPRMAQGGLFG